MPIPSRAQVSAIIPTNWKGKSYMIDKLDICWKSLIPEWRSWQACFTLPDQKISSILCIPVKDPNPSGRVHLEPFPSPFHSCCIVSWYSLSKIYTWFFGTFCLLEALAESAISPISLHTIHFAGATYETTSQDVPTYLLTGRGKFCREAHIIWTEPSV